MSICVVGGSGFIGTRLCQRLQQAGLVFDIVDKTPSLTFAGQTRLADVRSLDSLRQQVKTPQVLVNLAAEHRDDVRPLSLYDEVNVDGARNIATVAREHHINTIVFTSTVAVYGFAPLGTDESGTIAPFNDYGRTKHEAEQILQAWQLEAPTHRTLVIVRPTVVFGEQNRGNVYNLLRQIASGKFLMIGDGENRKSMAYVENVAAFIQHSMAFKPGVHIHNYIDKPDFNMNQLVGGVRRILGRPEAIRFRMPYALGFAIGQLFDVAAALSGKRFAVSAIRVKKFCSNSVFSTSVGKTGFTPPVPLEQALAKTVKHEFLEQQSNAPLFYSE